jgi:hypothetical protein
VAIVAVILTLQHLPYSLRNATAANESGARNSQ